MKFRTPAIVLCVSFITFGQSNFVIEKKYLGTKFQAVTLGLLPVKASNGEPEGFSALIQTKLIEELEKSKALTDVRLFALPSDSLTAIAIHKFGFKNEFRSYTPAHARVEFQKVSPDLLLFVKRTEMKTDQYQYSRPSGSTYSNPSTTTVNQTKSFTRFVVWDNKDGAVVAFGENVNRETSFNASPDSEDYQEIAEEIAQKIAKHIRQNILREE
jgi:hypothetical protein